MKRNLLTQIKNEWRDNLWLVIALTIVTGLIWIAAIIFYTNVKACFLPRGFSYENVFTLSVQKLSQKSPYYTAIEEENEDERRQAYYDDFRSLLIRLKENPNVENVGFHWGATPYSMNYSGFSLTRTDIKDTIPYTGNRRSCSPEVIDVLGYESMTGKTTEQLVEMVRRGEVLVSDNKVYEENGGNVMDLIGKTVFMGNDSSMTYKVGDVIRNVRRMDYEDSWGGTIINPLNEDTPWGDVVIKVRDGHDHRFKEDFKADGELRRQRNVYLSDLTKLADTRTVVQRPMDTSQHILVSLMTFLLLTIFLGLLGTFWFRMQQRVGEIAIRKVSGATKGDIFRRVISEGLILLCVASLTVSVIIWPFSRFFTGMFYCSYTELFVFEIIAICMVASGIVLSLWYPAWRAMRIEPAIALKTE